MSEIKDGGAVFPIICSDPNIPNEPGMSLRDYFAAKAMQSIFEDGQTWRRPSSYGDCANRAYRMADAMLKAREQ